MRAGTRMLSRVAIGTAVAAVIMLASAAEMAVQHESVKEVRRLPESIDGHRPLSANPAPHAPDPAPPAPFAGYADAPAYSVVPRHDALSFYPCADCHGMLPVNRERRHLYAPHPAALDHGAGRIWCLDCHAPDNRNTLRTLAAEAVSFDEAYLVCGQCHYNAQKDWVFGAHGKRVATWRGERELYNCTHCHNPHDPAVRPRAPEPPPPVRVGLDSMPHAGADDARAGSAAGEEGGDE